MRDLVAMPRDSVQECGPSAVGETTAPPAWRFFLPRPDISAIPPTGMQPDAMPVSFPSGLARRLAGGRFVMTAEVVPPVSCEPAGLMARALPRKGVADAVNVTDGAGARAHMAATAAAALLVQAGI